jgi:hypothetical protein
LHDVATVKAVILKFGTLLKWRCWFWKKNKKRNI